MQIRSFLALLPFCLATAACVTPTGDADKGHTAGSGEGAGGGTGEPPSTALDCAAIFDCAASCAETDEACGDACYGRGSPGAQTAVDAVVACWTEFGCTDAPCLQTNCSAQLQACIAPTASQPPPGEPPATGSLPQALAGQWAYASGSDYSLLLSADGQVVRVRDVYFGSCHSTSKEAGVAVADASTLTLTFTSGHFDICGQPSDKTEPYQEIYAYELETVPVDTFYPLGQSLHIVQQSCDGACDSWWLAKIE